MSRTPFKLHLFWKVTKLDVVAKYVAVNRRAKRVRGIKSSSSFLAVRPSRSHWVFLPEAEISEIYVAVNEWTGEKAGQYLAVYLKDDAKAFYH